MTIDMKTKIINVAVNLFSKLGFYGTTIRDIAKEANCSLSMVYYYFKNKEELFYEVAYNEFIKLNKKLDEETPPSDDIKLLYINAMTKRLRLQGYEKNVYKLALKTYYSDASKSEVYQRLSQWQQERMEFANINLKRFLGIEDKLLGNMLSRIFENIITKAVLLDYNVDEDQSIEELNHFFEMIIYFQNNIRRNLK